MRGWLDQAHPGAVLLSEWGDPAVAVPAGFHADFFLHFGGPTDGRPLRSLWDNGISTEGAGQATQPCFFDADGRGTAGTFLTAYQDAMAAIGEPGHIALPTANHDFARLQAGPRTLEQLPPAFAFLLTFPTLPAIYYGDEIGMRDVPGLPDTEGSVMLYGYNRAGARTPMQWDSSPNAGFSAAPPARLYLPIDPDQGRPTVAGQRADQDSLLNTVRDLIALRRAHPELGPGGSLEILSRRVPPRLPARRPVPCGRQPQRRRSHPAARPPRTGRGHGGAADRRQARPDDDHRRPVLLRDLPALTAATRPTNVRRRCGGWVTGRRC